MSRSGSWFGVVVLASAAGAGALFLISFLSGADVVREPFKGNCTPVSGIAGPEDAQIDAYSRRAYIASLDRESGEQRGGVFLVSLDDPLSDTWRDRTGGAPTRLDPVGLSLYEGGGLRRLFVANAASKTVELYEIEDGGDLRYLETFRERRLTSPSDVVGVGPRSFYVSNDVEPGRDSLLGAAHFLFRAGSGRIMHFDGVSWRVAADGLRFAGGLAASFDGLRLYATETAAASLLVYDRDLETGNLTLAKTVPLGAAADNINIDPTGTLWIGAQPKTLLTPSKKNSAAGSLVFGYDDLREIPSKPRLIFTDAGTTIAAATVAARLGRTLLVGSPAGNRFLMCELS